MLKNNYAFGGTLEDAEYNVQKHVVNYRNEDYYTECDYEYQNIDNAIDQISKQLFEHSIGNKELGVCGEKYAALRLIQKGWKIIDKNWHSKIGELDIIMLTPNKTIVFVEVKTRRNTNYGTPLEAVSVEKQRKVKRTGMQWLREHGSEIPHRSIRFDIVSILVVSKYTYSDSALTFQTLQEIRENNQNTYINSNMKENSTKIDPIHDKAIEFTHLTGAF